MLAAIRRDDAFEIHETTTERLWTIYPGRRYIRLGLRFRAFAFPFLTSLTDGSAFMSSASYECCAYCTQIWG